MRRVNIGCGGGGSVVENRFAGVAWFVAENSKASELCGGVTMGGVMLRLSVNLIFDTLALGGACCAASLAVVLSMYAFYCTFSACPFPTTSSEAYHEF